MDQKTPLYDAHVALGGKMVSFGGYLLPVQYGAGVIAEHMAVRTKAGLFDVSHMAELSLCGPDAVANIQNLCTTDISAMVDGQVKYAMFCNEQGGIVDDLVICRMAAARYLLVVNAGNHEKDVAWVQAHLFGDVQFADISDQLAQIALQGPASEVIVRKICAEAVLPNKYYSFVEHGVMDLGDRKIEAIISQTGYTGERGYEFYCKTEEAAALWSRLLAVGADEGLIPCGLGARDTLRLEASMPLYGHEMTDVLSPVEAGLPCKLDGKDFIGKQAIVARGAPKITRVGLKITGRGIAREHSPVHDETGEIGWVTSGTHCPYLGYAVAMAYLPIQKAALGTKVRIEVRGRMLDAEVTQLPFYKIKR